MVGALPWSWEDLNTWASDRFRATVLKLSNPSNIMPMQCLYQFQIWPILEFDHLVILRKLAKSRISAEWIWPLWHLTSFRIWPVSGFDHFKIWPLSYLTTFRIWPLCNSGITRWVPNKRKVDLSAKWIWPLWHLTSFRIWPFSDWTSLEFDHFQNLTT